jgi:hypothetical protein
VLAASAIGCGDRTTAPTDGPGNEPVVLPPDPDGMLLPGGADEDALGAVVSLQPTPVPPEQIADGRLTTRIRAVIHPDATVAQVNQVLEEQEAAIVSMLEGFPTVLLVVDPLATEEEARARADELAATEAFLAAFPGRTFGNDTTTELRHGTPDVVGPFGRDVVGPFGRDVTASIPGGWDETEIPYDYMRHLLLVHTWSLRAVLTDRVPVILADEFAQSPTHDEIPGLDWNEDQSGYLNGDLTRDGSRVIGNRGFHHAGIIGASWEGSNLVGVHPDATIIGVPIGGLDMTEVLSEISSELSRRPGFQILVTPFVFSTDPTVPIPLFSAMAAADWKRHLRRLGLENRVLHISSAGDTGQGSPGYSLSHNMSPWNLATSYSRLVDYLDGNDRELLLEYETILGFGPELDPGPIDNVIIVGASDEEGEELAISATLPHLVAPGERIAGPCTDPDPGGGPDDQFCNGIYAGYTGTGPAAALVGGIASYLWNLYPERSLDDIRNAIQIGYARNFGLGWIDTFDAALALDEGLFAPRVREAILDVTGDRDDYPNMDEPNGEFDEKDLKVFVDALAALAGQVPGLNDLRFDLNGDYSLEADRRNPFDLDVNSPPAFTTLTFEVHGMTVELDESSISDLEIVCYYAHSDLYLGDSEARDILLADCAEPTGLFVMSIRFPDTIAEAEEAMLEVRAGYEGASGDTAWARGIQIDLDVEGGTTTASSGVTDPDGWFRTAARLDPGSRSLSITVTARNEGGQEETETVVADADGPSFVRVIEGVIRADALFTCSAGDYGPGYAPIVESDRVNDRRDLTGAGSWTATAETGTNITHPFTNDQASARGAASVELNIDTFDAGDVVARISGSTSMFAEASSTRNDNHNGAGANGHTYLYLFFEIVGEPLHYELTSSFDGTPGQVDFFGEFYHHASDGPITAPQISGTLGGSRHRILISDVTCSASTNGGETSCEDGYEFVLTLTRR